MIEDVWKQIEEALPDWQILLRTNKNGSYKYFVRLIHPDYMHPKHDESAPHYYGRANNIEAALLQAFNQWPGRPIIAGVYYG